MLEKIIGGDAFSKYTEAIKNLTIEQQTLNRPLNFLFLTNISNRTHLYISVYQLKKGASLKEGSLFSDICGRELDLVCDEDQPTIVFCKDKYEQAEKSAKKDSNKIYVYQLTYVE